MVAVQLDVCQVPFKPTAQDAGVPGSPLLCMGYSSDGRGRLGPLSPRGPQEFSGYSPTLPCHENSFALVRSSSTAIVQGSSGRLPGCDLKSASRIAAVQPLLTALETTATEHSFAP